MDPVAFGVLTASDRASAGDYEDLSGPAIEEFLNAAIVNPFTIERRIVPDVKGVIAATLIDLCEAGCSVIITTGGTGPAPRDVTPDATDISFWVLFPPDEMQARYNAAAAIPIGSFPATIPSFFAFVNISIAFRFVFSPSPAMLAILDTPLIGSATGILRSSSL